MRKTRPTKVPEKTTVWTFVIIWHNYQTFWVSDDGRIAYTVGEVR